MGEGGNRQKGEREQKKGGKENRKKGWKGNRKRWKGKKGRELFHPHLPLSDPDVGDRKSRGDDTQGDGDWGRVGGFHFWKVGYIAMVLDTAIFPEDPIMPKDWTHASLPPKLRSTPYFVSVDGC